MSDVKLIKRVSNMDRAALAADPKLRNYFTQLALNEEADNPAQEEPGEITDEDVRDMIRKVLTGTRAQFGEAGQWGMAMRKQREEEESIEYIKTWMSELEGMEERAGQIGMIAGKLLRLDDDEQIVLVTRHVPRTTRTRWMLDEITPIFSAALNASVLVALKVAPRLGGGSKPLRDAIVARHFGVPQGAQVDVAARLGITPEHFCLSFNDARKKLTAFELKAFGKIKEALQK